MALDTTLFKHLLNVKGTVVEDIEFFHETDGAKSAVVQVHATRGYRCRRRFRNVENLKAKVLLCCSNLVIPLPNHAVSGKPAKQQPSGELLDFFTHNYARRALKIEPLIFKVLTTVCIASSANSVRMSSVEL